MDRGAIEKLRDQYLHDSSVIFAMPRIMQEVKCGTAFCIAGQAAVNLGYHLEEEGGVVRAVRGGESEEPWTVAVMSLGLNDTDGDADGITESERLFEKENWPDDLRDQPDTPALAAERLQRFLDSDGDE